MTKKISEDKLLAELYLNFSGKGKQKEDWISIAEKLNALKEYYPSDNKLANVLGISREMVRSTLKLNKLPIEIKRLVKSGELSQDLGWRLLAIQDQKSMIATAKSIIGLSAHDARDMIRFTKNNPTKSSKKQIDRLRKVRSESKKLNLILLTLDDDEFNKIQKLAKVKKLGVNEFIKEMIKGI